MREAPSPETLGEIDRAHSQLREAYARRDIAAYCDGLHPDLDYRGVSGQSINRARLLRDVQDQFDRLVAYRTEFLRTNVTQSGDEVTETGTQEALVVLTVLLWLAVRWRIQRTGTYIWRRTSSGWQLLSVRLDAERVTRDRIGLAAQLAAIER